MIQKRPQRGLVCHCRLIAAAGDLTEEMRLRRGGQFGVTIQQRREKRCARPRKPHYEDGTKRRGVVFVRSHTNSSLRLRRPRGPDEDHAEGRVDAGDHVFIFVLARFPHPSGRPHEPDGVDKEKGDAGEDENLSQNVFARRRSHSERRRGSARPVVPEPPAHDESGAGSEGGED